MQMATLTPKPGARFRLRMSAPFDLPDGLSEGQEVTMIERDESAALRIKDDEGREYRIPLQCAEMEHIYLLDGRWVREKHPAVLDHLRHMIAELEETRPRWEPGIARANEENLARFRAAVSRWTETAATPQDLGQTAQSP